MVRRSMERLGDGAGNRLAGSAVGAESGSASELAWSLFAPTWDHA